ncbi:hypothetical protein ACFO0N_12995 [Halobium salinum]|uniref:Uncharacterized protein n=1 Tax=Halobium salinum TaxID=1364940 RepID=A0ABD5PDS7_9EURY|nr:hypothetical protein [Halobium salinum]
MLRAIIRDGIIECDDFNHGEHGVDLYSENDDLIAFVPYNSLVALINEDVEMGDEPAIADD